MKITVTIVHCDRLANAANQLFIPYTLTVSSDDEDHRSSKERLYTRSEVSGSFQISSVT
jgi:hypothetical protein